MFPDIGVPEVVAGVGLEKIGVGDVIIVGVIDKTPVGEGVSEAEGVDSANT